VRSLMTASTTKAEHIVLITQQLADERPGFFAIKGAGAGDRDTNAFMVELRRRAVAALATDYSERSICGSNKLTVDFYIPDERTVIEVALSLRNPGSEFERDILKALMAAEAGNAVDTLLLISKPGGRKRTDQPGARAIIDWVQAQHGLRVIVHDLVAAHAA